MSALRQNGGDGAWVTYTHIKNPNFWHFSSIVVVQPGAWTEIPAPPSPPPAPPKPLTKIERIVAALCALVDAILWSR